ncbi:unnamed protein product [Aphanomyces euteiches]
MSSRRGKTDAPEPSSSAAPPPPSSNAPPPSRASQRAPSEKSSVASDDDSDGLPDNLSEAGSRRRNERPRFDSRASWADSTRLDRFDSRASMMSNRERSDSRVSNASRASSRKSARASELRASTLVTSKTPNLDVIDEEDYQFVSPFTDFDANDQPIREQLQKGLDIVNEHTVELTPRTTYLTVLSSQN